MKRGRIVNTVIVLCLVFLSVLIYLLFAPFYLEIDSARELIAVRFHHLTSMRVLTIKNSFLIELKIAGFKRRLDPLNKMKTTVKYEEQLLNIRRKRKQTISYNRIKAILKSFKINKCYVNLDFGNAAWNGMMYPLCVGLSRFTGKNFNVNFLGEEEFKLEIENNFARVIWAYITN